MRETGGGAMTRALSLALAVASRCGPPPDASRGNDAWIVTVEAARETLLVAASSAHEGWEGSEPVFHRVLNHAIGSILCLLFLLDGKRHRTASDSSYLLARVDPMHSCFPCYPLAEHQACLIERAGKCKANLDRARKAMEVSSHAVPTDGKHRKTMQRGGLLAYASDDWLASAAKKQHQDAVDKATQDLEAAMRDVRDPVPSHAASFLDRLATVARGDPSLLHVPDTVAATKIILDVVAGMVDERGNIDGGDDIEAMLPPSIATRFPRPTPVLPERVDLDRLQRSIGEIESALGTLDALQDDPALDSDERRTTKARRVEMERRSFETRHRKIQLENRLQWKEPEAHREADARWLVRVLEGMKNDLANM